MPVDLDNPDDFKELSAVIKGFSNDTRLALLFGLNDGYTVQEIADFLDMTRGGLQNNIYKMMDADLVYRPSDDEAPPYQLTPLGQLIADLLNYHGEAILEARELLATTEEQLTQEVAASPLAEGLSDSEADKLVHTKKWADTGQQITRLLRHPGAKDYEPPKQEPKEITQIILHKVAEREGVAIGDLPALIDVFDPSTFAQFVSAWNGQPGDHIQFTYMDYTITVTAAGEVIMEPRSNKDISAEN